jgi:hypothetical protein
MVSNPCACPLIHIHKLYSTSIYKTPSSRPKGIRRICDLIEHNKHVAPMQGSPNKMFVGEAERKIPLNGDTILTGGWLLVTSGSR